MKRFEYRYANREENWTLAVVTQEDADKIIAERVLWLNEFGKEGWEVIKIDYAASGNPYLFLKREIDG